jgi:HK97 family phage major capsid protein
MALQDLRQKKGELAAQAQAILDASPVEGLRAEDETKFNAIHVDIEKITREIAIREKQDAVNASLAEPQGRKTETVVAPAGTQVRGFTKPSATDALRAWLLPDQYRTPELRQAAARFGINDLNARQVDLKLLADRPLKSLDRESEREWEERAQGVATGGAGGFTVPNAPMQSLERALLFFGGMRQVANVLRTDTGAALPFPTVNDTNQAGVRLAENTQVALQDATFGQLTMNAYKYSSKAVLISVELLQDNAINAAEVIGSILGERIGRIQNTEFTTGTGSSQPNGIVTAATSGKVGLTGQTTTVIYDDLVDLLHSIDPAYRPGAKWMFHDATLKVLKKIKVLQYSGDTTGYPLWQPALSQGAPDTILGYPYVINNDMPTMAANAKSILFGEFRKYMIREVREVTLLRLEERYADFHQVGFLAFARADGNLLDAGTHPVKYYQNSAT